jgi:hypothetical protein
MSVSRFLEKEAQDKTIRNRNMSHAFTIICFGEEWHFKTDHCPGMHIRQVFEDLLSFRNLFHWDEVDLENFLAVKGRLTSECIRQLQSNKNDTIPAVLASEKFKNIKKIIVCVYSHSALALTGYGKILETVQAEAPPETKILTGWIRDEKTKQRYHRFDRSMYGVE